MESGIPPIDVLVHWHPHYLPTHSARDRIAAGIFRAIAEAESPIKFDYGSLELKAPWPVGVWPREVLSLRLARFPGLTRLSIRPAIAGWNMTLEPDHLQSKITEKDARFSGFDSDLAECWLLASISGFQPSTFVDFAPSALEAKYVTLFRRVFVLWQFDRRVTELTCRLPG